MTTTTTLPGQPDGIADDSNDLPSPVRAAERVREYISANGDGIYDVIDGHPLYARDLESLRRAGDQVGNLVMDADKLRAQVAELADQLHKANAQIHSLEKATTAYANEVAAKDAVIEAAIALRKFIGDDGSFAEEVDRVEAVDALTAAEVAR